MRNPQERESVQWWDRFGTVSGVEGIFPEYKITECVDTIINLSAIHAGGAAWVKNTDFHYHHIKCPYSSESTTHYVRNTNPSSPNYWNMELLLSGFSVHSSTGGMMIKYVNGSRRGWLCVDPNCTYFLQNGVRYFYH